MLKVWNINREKVRLSSGDEVVVVGERERERKTVNFIENTMLRSLSVNKSKERVKYYVQY